MPLTIFLTAVFCAAMALMLLSAVVFIQDKRFFSLAPREIQAVIEPRPEELFPGARLLVTHNAAIRRMAHRVLTIRDGRVTEEIRSEAPVPAAQLEDL